MAMQAVDDQLVRRDDALIQLLDPPFDQSDLDPGYIKGYVPGVRENGGQYTHAAIWAAMAFAALGDRDRAWQLITMINPITHADAAEGVATYKVEPYVIAADVYAVEPHVGRGGWTWYTGSAGWMYRLLVESLLGVTREENRLRFKPCIPPHWPGFRIDHRHGETLYEISVVQAHEGDGGIDVTRVQHGRRRAARQFDCARRRSRDAPSLRRARAHRVGAPAHRRRDDLSLVFAF